MCLRFSSSPCHTQRAPPQPTVRASSVPKTVSGADPRPPMGASSCSARASFSQAAASAGHDSGRRGERGRHARRVGGYQKHIMQKAAWAALLCSAMCHTPHLCTRLPPRPSAALLACAAPRHRGEQLAVAPGQQGAHAGVDHGQLYGVCGWEKKARRAGRKRQGRSAGGLQLGPTPLSACPICSIPPHMPPPPLHTPLRLPH